MSVSLVTKRSYNIKSSDFSRTSKNKLLTSSEIFLYKNHPLPCSTVLCVKCNWGYSRNARSHYFIINSVLLLIRVDTLPFMKAQKVICKYSQEETEKTASLGLLAAEHPWELGGGKLGKLELLPVAALAIDPHPLAQRIIILFRFCSRRAIEPNEEIRTILRLHQTSSPSPKGPTEFHIHPSHWST